MDILEEYLKSDFYKKYSNTYYSDSILKDVFGRAITKHRVSLKSYKDVYEKNIEVMQDFIEYANEAQSVDEYSKWLMLYSFYIDPDGKSIKYAQEVACSADGLVSLRRIYNMYGMNQKLVEEYKKYRKVPIFHFPKETNGINMSRSALFGDRIDHTLYDIKRMCEGKDNCRLKLAYSLPKTKSWLECFQYNFERIVEWLEVGGIFVDENYNIYDLEKNDNTTIINYKDYYKWEWTDSYYNNIKAKISKYYEERKV